MSGAVSNYAIVSPARDEEQYLERTIHSVLKQTVKPSRWVIVDDGSQDRTPEIARRYAQAYDWITALTVRSEQRAPGAGVIRAFNAGYAILEQDTFDLIVKLDCDVELPSDYFEQLINRFCADARLGIASGVYLECNRGRWTHVRMPAYHAAGASKVLRTACFRDIGGFVPVRGWDTIDQIKAQMTGWTTMHFPELAFYHLRREGAAIGFLRTSLQSGEGYYRTGGGPLFFALKAVQRAFRGKPLFAGAALMIFGYVRASLQRKQLLVSAAEAKFYRRQLNRRILKRARDVVTLKAFARTDRCTS